MVDEPKIAITKINNIVIELQQDEKKNIRVFCKEWLVSSAKGPKD
jgi:hypothetical protein